MEHSGLGSGEGPGRSGQRFAGQVALVTGASSGVGKSVSLALAEQGATVYLVGRNEDRLAATQSEAAARGGLALPHTADLTVDDDLQGIADRIVADFGGLDVLVHAAGVMAGGTTAAATISDLDRQYRTNLRAPYGLTQLLLPALRERRGQVVFINSTQGASAAPKAGQYAASKHGLRAVADSLRAEVNEHGVRVLTILLGQTATPMQQRLYEAEGRSYHPDQLIQPRDVADMVLGALAVPPTAQVAEMTVLPTTPPPEEAARRIRTANSLRLIDPNVIAASSLLAETGF
jgi:NADP-dependent 3-hydroxy acid dehydrogenase YdfG